MSKDSHIDFVFVCFSPFLNRQSLRQANAACAHVLFNLMSCPPRLSQGLFFLHARELVFFLTLGLYTVLLSSSTCDCLLFRDFIATSSARGFVAGFTEAGVHGALDRDDAPVPQVVEDILEVIKVIPQERVSERIVEQIVDVPVLRFMEEIVDTVAGEVICTGDSTGGRAHICRGDNTAR